MLQQFLVTVFGDVPAIIASAEQLCEFCLLPHTAVLVWARADNLRVHSENCVVLLLSAWIHAYGNVHGAALEDDMEASSDDEDDKNAHLYVELANCVRVLQLSPSYLQHIVPKLSWFQGCRGIKFLPHLQLQKSAGLDVDVQGSSARDFCAPSWLANAREAADSMPSSSTEWVVKSAELELLASSSCFPHRFTGTAHSSNSGSSRSPASLDPSPSACISRWRSWLVSLASAASAAPPL